MGADTSSLKGAAKNDQFSWLSNLSPGYVGKLKEKFELASDDFTLDKPALKQYFKCSDRECQFIFEHFDQDGNGKIDSYEFICAMALLSHGTLDDKADLIFSIYDFDGNKFLTRDELVILMTNVLSSMKALKKLPAPSISEVEVKVDEFFKRADSDGDKMITLQEFKKYIKVDKEILEILLQANIAQREDLGKDYGKGTTGVPATDPDLDSELNPKGLEQTDKKLLHKEGSMAELEGYEVDDVGAGDQFMAVKPFVGVIKNSVPSRYKPSTRDGEAPDASLNLEYIHGYRCHDTRNNLRYTATGEIVYHAAAVGIVLNQKTNQQRFVIEHNDDILCLAIDPSGKYCATGQIGPKPMILIWDNDTMEVKHRISGTLLKGIKSLAFSQDGKYLAASAFDDDHCIAVYSGWNAPLKPGQTMKPIATGKGCRANIMSLGFNPDSTQVIATCVKEVNFFSFNGGIIKAKKGTGLDLNAQAVLCQAFAGATLYTGLFDGRIATWTGSAVKGYLQAHTDGCHSLQPRQNGLISGGGDGLIIIWQSSPTGLTQAKQFDLKVPEIKSLIPKVRSVCENTSTGQILVGTRGGEIVEFGGAKPLVYIRSHHTGELWGLATHPMKEEYITVGQDNFMAIWDIKNRKQRRFGKLEQAANVVQYSNSGQMLAIGYINGSVQVLHLEQGFAMKANKKDRKEAISEIKFSPDDSILAVGAHDSLIITYDARNNFALLRRIRKNLSTVSHFDFSLDGQFLVSNSTSYEILYFDVQTGNQITGGASQFKDETWATYTCHLGWAVQGIWPALADGTDINAVDRSPEGLVTATADDFGTVKLFKHPSPVQKASFNEYRGHSSHVTNVRFLKNSPYLISTGGEDKCIFQWKYNFDKQSAEESKKISQVDISNIADDLGAEPQAAPIKSQPTMKKPLQDEEFQMEEVGEGDQRLAVLPFLGQVERSKPTGWKELPGAGQKPDGNVKLSYAHGFRSFDTRHNLKYVTKDDIVFSTAALGVVLNKPSNTQKFFNMHAEDIVSLAIHPSKDIIATGQMAQAGKAKQIDIFVWKISTMQMLAQLNNFHLRAVRRLEFSPAGDKLLSIGQDDQNSVAIYDWANKKLLCKSGVDPDKVLDAAWANETSFATVGMKCVKFFQINGANLQSQKGLLAASGAVPISCIYAFGSFLTGCSNGNLIQWNGGSIGKTFKQHTDALWCLMVAMGGQTLITGGNDAKIVLWDKTFAPKQIIDLSPMSKFPTGVRSIDYHEQAKTFLVGTRGAEIIELSSAGTKIKTLISGHYQEAKTPEVWGCAVHPRDQTFASCGSDSTIRIWSKDQMLRASDPFKDDLTAIDWSSDGKFIIAGDRQGFIHLIDPQTLKELAQAGSSLVGKSNNAWIEDLKISPDCTKVVFGSHGGLSKIEIVEILEGGKKLRPIKATDAKITSALTHLDWSADSRFVVVNSQAYELVFIDVANKQQLPASSAKDIDWQTWTSVLGFPVQGIWAPCSDFTDVNSVCRSQSHRFLASAEDSGLVKLFKYPCTVKNAQFNEFRAHSSHVTKVKFSVNDKFLITTGGNDKTVIVWETDFGFGEEDQDHEDAQQSFIEMVEDDYEELADFKTIKVDQVKVLKTEAKEAALKTMMTQKRFVEEDNPFEEDDVGLGNESLAVQPWKGQSMCPSTWKKPPVNQNKPPALSLKLEWVHGYRSRDSRNNIGVALDGNIVYQAAAVGVGYDPATHTQRHFIAHTDDITAIAFSPDRTLVVTGEVGAQPKILIWDAVSMQLKVTIKHKLTKGIQALAFSPSGKTIAAVAVDIDHTVAAFNSTTGVCIGTSKGDTAQILDIAMKDDMTFSTTGVKHYMVWNIASNNLTSKRGLFGDKDPKHAPCAYSGEYCLTGAITGEVYVWQGPQIKQALANHTALVDSIHVSKGFIFTGGKDMKVNVINASTFAVLFSFSIDDKWQSICGRVKALCLDNDQLYVGTLGSEIYQVKVDLAKKTVGVPKLLVNGHFSPCLKDTNEVWGLCLFNENIVTVSDDSTLRIWDANTHKQIQCISLLNDDKGNPLPLDAVTKEPSNSCKGRAVDISPNGKLCAVGFRDGSVRLFNTTGWKQMKTISHAKKLLIQDLKFSPNGQYLAVSSHDMLVYIYDVANFDKKPVVCKGSTSAVTHIDWSTDSKWIHSNDLSYELLFYSATTGEQDRAGSRTKKDEEWATWSLPQGWPVQGIWPPSADGSDINCVDRSSIKIDGEYNLVASGDDKSMVKIFRYPCIDQASKPLEAKGHSSHVTNVKFSKDGKRLFSAGGNDTCIFQWSLAPLQ